MKKKQNLLSYHKRWCEKKEIPFEGLCQSLTDIYFITGGISTYRIQLDEYFEPTKEEMLELRKEGLSSAYWASGKSVLDSDRHYAYTELRQNIILLLCAINDEL